jgi:preprotein translocase subunit SecD
VPAWGCLRPAYDTGESTANPSQVDAQALTALTPFGMLAGQEVVMSPTQMQYTVPAITCRQLEGRLPTLVPDPLHDMASCGSGAEAVIRYRLDVARERGDDLADALAQRHKQGGWQILIRSNAVGQNRRTALTRLAMEKAAPDGDRHPAAIMLDWTVMAVMAVISGDVVIKGSGIDRTAAERVVDLRKRNTLPVVFNIVNLRTQSESPW